MKSYYLETHCFANFPDEDLRLLVRIRLIDDDPALTVLDYHTPDNIAVDAVLADGCAVLADDALFADCKPVIVEDLCEYGCENGMIRQAFSVRFIHQGEQYTSLGGFMVNDLSALE